MQILLFYDASCIPCVSAASTGEWMWMLAVMMMIMILIITIIIGMGALTALSELNFSSKSDKEPVTTPVNRVSPSKLTLHHISLTSINTMSSLLAYNS
jgi:heme/copper-type cytochrome/quinol oxidase subunit 2